MENKPNIKVGTIKTAINTAVDKIKAQQKPTTHELLALSLFSGGENTLRITKELKDRVTDYSFLSNNKNKLTIPAIGSKSMLIGETYPIEVCKPNGEVIEGTMMVNIELLAISAEDMAVGSTPLEITHNLEPYKVGEILRLVSNGIDKEPIVMNNHTEMVIKLYEKVTSEDSDVLIKVGNAVTTLSTVGSTTVVKHIEDITEEVPEIIDTTANILHTYFI